MIDHSVCRVPTYYRVPTIRVGMIMQLKAEHPTLSIAVTASTAVSAEAV